MKNSVKKLLKPSDDGDSQRIASPLPSDDTPSDQTNLAEKEAPIERSPPMLSETDDDEQGKSGEIILQNLSPPSDPNITPIDWNQSSWAGIASYDPIEPPTLRLADISIDDLMNRIMSPSGSQGPSQ